LGRCLLASHTPVMGVYHDCFSLYSSQLPFSHARCDLAARAGHQRIDVLVTPATVHSGLLCTGVSPYRSSPAFPRRASMTLTLRLVAIAPIVRSRKGLGKEVPLGMGDV
jgi:hypothetical protein